MNPPLLRLEHVNRQIGGLRILNDINLRVEPAEILGLIGPNGAGKTSLFNIISGQTAADSGQLYMAEQVITTLSVSQRARLGMARSFQTSRIFPELSLLDNLAMAIRIRLGSAYRWWRSKQSLVSSQALASELLQGTPLATKQEQMAATLSYGEQRILDVLLCLAQQPQLLLLDEPTAGLSQAESRAVMTLVHTHRHQCSILLISHDIDIVMQHCQRVAVLSQGNLLACDTPDRIKRHPLAQQAYLGAAGLPGVSP
ncbi:ABC transporter ATP-binding protein [Alcaligenes endophyticus]|uniref:ATP-binding cassette domain-containing protein n=1 Tax=Alcaligenes endophyticus TaxID=1929088 RepID=A0ABT8ELI5_9BURK|nr:ATP-binding cassette domain-containing protein [Alcaligenes endophyticus]MCX5591261.1 ATP-binding cassette domain-containing protein [Alcaligenes endophyticus]MDN4122161.1 ATP-binding cassette domain-containing protein [Alcaligenes endophyticus]